MDATRHAALRGLDIDETWEVLHRDWMRIEGATGNTAGVRKAIARLQRVSRTYDISLEPLTERMIDLVLSESPCRYLCANRPATLITSSQSVSRVRQA